MARTNAQQKLGKQVRLLRLSMKLTQESLAEITGLDRTYISGIERGVRNPSLRNLEKLAKAFKIKLSALTDFE